jgi:hypothetical protein
MREDQLGLRSKERKAGKPLRGSDSTSSQPNQLRTQAGAPLTMTAKSENIWSQAGLVGNMRQLRKAQHALNILTVSGMRSRQRESQATQ